MSSKLIWTVLVIVAAIALLFLVGSQGFGIGPIELLFLALIVGVILLGIWVPLRWARRRRG